MRKARLFNICKGEPLAMLQFRNDYCMGAHPEVLAALSATNLEGNVGYGADDYCARCADLIRELCQAPGADVQFLIGGTQANFTAIAAFLRPWEGVICAQSGHINGHEGGAVEATGHKLFQVPTGPEGKVTPEAIEPVVKMCTDPHVAKAAMVYISDATETGGVYTLAELEALSACCRANGLLLFLDGARLSSALTAVDNDVTLPDLARLCDAFYIGGTKNGALMGEALVIVKPELQTDFFRVKKQRGAVLAKGWLLGVQFQALLEKDLYWDMARHANTMAQRLQAGLMAKGYAMANVTTTNQIFPIVPRALLATLDRVCTYELWSENGGGEVAVRFVTCFTTTEADVDTLLAALPGKQ